MKRFAFIILTLCMSSLLCAGTKIGKIYYNLYSNTKTAEVTFEPNKSYTGSIEIPTSITVGNDIYRVTRIGNNAFKNNSSIVITNNSSIENTVGVWENIFGVDVCTGDVAVEGNVITYIYNKKPC